jgi:hypothetical protein
MSDSTRVHFLAGAVTGAAVAGLASYLLYEKLRRDATNSDRRGGDCGVSGSNLQNGGGGNALLYAVPPSSSSIAAAAAAGGESVPMQHEQHASLAEFDADDILSEQLTRNVQFFGLEAQKRIARSFVVVVGLGVRLRACVRRRGCFVVLLGAKMRVT